MKNKIAIAILTCLLLTSCHKEPGQAMSSTTTDQESTLSDQFENTDERLSHLFDQLANAQTSDEVRKQRVSYSLLQLIHSCVIETV